MNSKPTCGVLAGIASAKLNADLPKPAARLALISLLLAGGGGWAGSAEVIGWGLNNYGQINPPAELANVVALSTAGGYADVDGAYSLALLADGSVTGWGNSSFGQTTIPAGLSNVVAISGNTYHCLALTGNGRVTAWGSNAYGQTNVPANLSNVVALAAGAYHSLALTAQGTVIGWGAGGAGQQGWPHAGQTVNPAGLSNVVAIYAGLQYSMALKADGRVVAWGANTQGALNVPADLSNAVAIAAGDVHSLAVKSDGTVVAWGWNQEGISTVPTGLSNVVSVAAGNRVSLALRADGSVAGWGFWNTKDIPPSLDKAVEIDAGYLHCLALRRQSEATARPIILNSPFAIGTVQRPIHFRIRSKNEPSGYGASGLPPGLSLDSAQGLITGAPAQSGDYEVILTATNDFGSDTKTVRFAINRPVPAIQTSGLIPAFPGQPFYLSIVADNEPAWFGAAGLPTGLTINLQTGVISGTAPFATGDYTVSLQASNQFGVGVGSLVIRLSSVVGWGAGPAISPTPFGPLSQIAAGNVHSLALKPDGTLITWGSTQISLTNIPVSAAPAKTIAAGGSHSMALRMDGTVVAWGDNQGGQTNVPAGLNNVVAVAAGGYHSLALQSNGNVVGWGGAGRGGAGQGQPPVNLGVVVAIAAGYQHSLALRQNGTVACWGSNSSGQTNLPAGLNNVIAIGAGDEHSLALRSDGSVVAWGSGSYGVTNVPTDLSNVVAVSSHGIHNLALRKDGTVVSWGNNSSGQTNVPAGLREVVAIAAGGTHSLALLQVRPLLSSIRSGPSAIRVSWPRSASSWVLQESVAPAIPDWSDNGTAPTDDGTNLFLTIPAVPSQKLFRLRGP